MILKILISLIILSVTYVIYKFYIKPQREFEWYRKNLQKLGYKTLVYPFQAFKTPISIERKKHQIEKGDPYYRIKSEYQNYDVSFGNFINSPFLQILNPSLIQEFYTQKNQEIFIKAPIFTSTMGQLIGNGILFDEGQNWKRKKKILTQVFNHDFIKSQIPKIQNICEKSMDFIEQKYRTEKQSQYQFNVIQLAQLIFSTVIAECFFGQSVSNQKLLGDTIPVFLEKLFADIGRLRMDPLVILFTPKILKLKLTKSHRNIYFKIRTLRQWGLNFVRNRIKKIEEDKQNLKTKQFKDILETFILNDRYSNQKEINNDRYNEKELLEEFIIFYIAGTQTTSNFLQVMLYQIVTNPFISQKLRKQISQKIKQDSLTYQSLKDCSYIELLQKQTGRFFGPTTTIFPRVAKQDCYIENIPIKKNTIVCPRFNRNFYNEKYFDKPFDFNPERFEKQDKQIHPYVLMNFSAGKRTCIGKSLAMLESKIALIKIMKRYKTMIPPQEPLRYKFGFLLTTEKFSFKFIK